MSSSISLFFAGDFAPVRRYEKLVIKNGYKIFGSLQNNISESDLSFLNLETPLCINGKPIKKTGPNFKAHPDCINAVKDAGFDVVGLANNHIMDFGNEGVLETINSCKIAGLTICGAGKNIAEAQKTVFIERCGLKIAYIAVAEHEFCIAGKFSAGAAPLDPLDITLQIESIKNHADLVIISIHGGNEYFPLPRPGLKKICRYFISRGADAVVCHHPHVPGAFEIYKDKPIIYSLGNLIFDHPNPPKDWNKSYAVKLNFDLNKKNFLKLEPLPYLQSVQQGGVYSMPETDKAIFLKKIELNNKILNDEKLYKKSWDDFCKKEERLIILKNYAPVNFRGMRKLSKIFNPEIFLVPTLKNRLVKLNLIRCESHRELLQNVLNDKNID